MSVTVCVSVELLVLITSHMTLNESGVLSTMHSAGSGSADSNATSVLLAKKYVTSVQVWVCVCVMNGV